MDAYATKFVPTSTGQVLGDYPGQVERTRLSGYSTVSEV